SPDSSHLLVVRSLHLRHPPSATLFPYTTLFRSRRGPDRGGCGGRRGHAARAYLRPALFGPRRLGRDREAQGARDEHPRARQRRRSEEHTSELQSRENLVCRLLLEKKKKKQKKYT